MRNALETVVEHPSADGPARDLRRPAGERAGGGGPCQRAVVSQALVMDSGLRGARERVIQTLWFEGLGLLLVAPLYGAASGSGLGDSFALIAALSLVVMLWSALYNSAFDWIERRRTGRVASDRPHGLRALHALGLEASAVVASCPVVMCVAGLGWLDALLADTALTLAYAAYGYVFHWAFDRLRPVPPHQPPP